MKLEVMVLGRVGTNCYLMMNEETKEAIIIDPADQADKINNKLEELGATPVAILLTHGHFDHVLAADELREKYQIKVYANKQEVETLMDTKMNMSGMGGKQSTYEPDILIQDKDKLHLAGMDIQVIWTPGHTPGGTCYYIEEDNVLFSGDTLFQHSVGRTDFPGGSMSSLVRSIKEKLFLLDDQTRVFPGHMGPTTIGDERINNPFLG